MHVTKEGEIKCRTDWKAPRHDHQQHNQSVHTAYAYSLACKPYSGRRTTVQVVPDLFFGWCVAGGADHQDHNTKITNNDLPLAQHTALLSTAMIQHTGRIVTGDSSMSTYKDEDAIINGLTILIKCTYKLYVEMTGIQYMVGTVDRAKTHCAQHLDLWIFFSQKNDGR